MAVSQVGSTTTSYYVTNGAKSASTSSKTVTSSTTAGSSATMRASSASKTSSTTAGSSTTMRASSASKTSSTTVVSSTTMRVSSASKTSSTTVISSTTSYESATAKTTCSTTVTYSGSSSTAKVSSTTIATVGATSTNKAGASASTTASPTVSATARVASSTTLQNKIDDSILRIKAELDKETGIYIPPYYPTSASTTALSQTMTGLMADIGKGSMEEDSIKYAKIVLQEMYFYQKDEMEIATGKLSEEYNDSLEQSVRRFQTMFQLSVTGKIDEETWKEIHKQLYDGYAIKRENNKQVLTEALSSMRDEDGIELVEKRYYTEESINDLLDTITEFGIDDDTELQVFLAQALHECLGDLDGIENGKKDWEYAGAGALQLTGEYNYISFAVYEMLRENPEMQEHEYIDTDFVFFANNDEEDVLNNYDNAKLIAKDLGIDIKKYTDIVDVGKTYVAENYFWKSAGFFWMSEGIGKKIEGLTLDEGMVISTEDVNSEEKKTNPEIYKDRLHKTEYIKSVSDILEGMQW